MSQENVHWELFLCVCRPLFPSASSVAGPLCLSRACPCVDAPYPPWARRRLRPWPLWPLPFSLHLFSPLFPLLPALPVRGPFPLPLLFFPAPSSFLSFLCAAFSSLRLSPYASMWLVSLCAVSRPPPSVAPPAVFLCKNFCFLNLLSSSSLRVLPVFFRPGGLKKVAKRFGDTEKSSTFAIPFEKWASLSGRWFCEKSASAMLQRVFFGNFPGLRASGKFFEKSFGESKKRLTFAAPFQDRAEQQVH